VSFTSAIDQWDEGQRRLRDVEPEDRPVLERAIERAVEELRKRLGGAFSAAELAELYRGDGIDWCLDIAIETAPENPRAWDAKTIADAAFARYLREATDYAGGRRTEG
jgi:hypothetical protein